ncbi:MAG: flagellar basal body P-ring protein FlgI [Armatimonadota bacterium]|nr:flagellar basal body P-ring protein FlgI [Armatimonadota bacterium]
MRLLATLLLLSAIAAQVASPAACADSVPSAGAGGVRIKDIARVQGARDNQLVGYGLIVGLEGTGDSAQVPFTNQAVRNLVTRFGTRPDITDEIKTKNAATVIVTATLPPFVKPGDRIDVTVSSLADARSLQGGVLLQTPLLGADGEIYAVAQGAVSIGGFAAAGAGAEVSKNHPTVGRIPAGALVEASVPSTLSAGGILALSLHNPDYASAVAVASAINRALAAPAVPQDPATVIVSIPAPFEGRPTEFLAAIGRLAVPVDAPARVVINERTGTIVVGGPVTISPVAVAHGSLTVEIHTTAAVYQPPPLSRGETVVVPEGAVTAREETAVIAPLGTATVDDLVRSLNALHATPRDLIAILQAIKEAGALHAEMEVL